MVCFFVSFVYAARQVTLPAIAAFDAMAALVAKDQEESSLPHGISRDGSYDSWALFLPTAAAGKVILTAVGVSRAYNCPMCHRKISSPIQFGDTGVTPLGGL